MASATWAAASGGNYTQECGVDSTAVSPSVYADAAHGTQPEERVSEARVNLGFVEHTPGTGRRTAKPCSMVVWDRGRWLAALRGVGRRCRRMWERQITKRRRW